MRYVVGEEDFVLFSPSLNELSHSESEDGKEVRLFDFINKSSVYEVKTKNQRQRIRG